MRVFPLNSLIYVKSLPYDFLADLLTADLVTLVL